jgi:outer membrane putative beta-barrel porin/alpha-amylase
MNRNIRYAPLGALIALCAAPAAADHMGPSGFGSGGGMTVSGPDTLDEGHWATSLHLVYTRPEQRSDAALEALAGEHIHAHNTDYNLNGSLGVAYGVTHHLTISAELPYVRRDGLREGEHGHEGGEAVNEVVALGKVSGVGDASILAKYRLTEVEGPGFALIGGIKLPTGSTHRRSPEGERLETEHQPGSGSWDPIVGAAGSARFGKATLSASGLYQFSTTGAQETRLGDRFQGGIAVSFRLSRAEPEHEHHHDAGEAEHHHHDEAEEARTSSWDGFVELAGEWEGRQRIGGEIEQASGGKWAYVAPGVRFNSASGWFAGASFALPVWQRIRASHPDNRYRATLSIGRAF